MPFIFKFFLLNLIKITLGISYYFPPFNSKIVFSEDIVSSLDNICYPDKKKKCGSIFTRLMKHCKILPPFDDA